MIMMTMMRTLLTTKRVIDFRVYLHCNLIKCSNAPSLSALRSFLYPSFPCTHICLFWPVFVWLVSFHSLSHTSGKRVLAAFFPFQLRNCWGSGEWSLSAAAAAGGRGAVERMLVKVDILYTTPVMNFGRWFISTATTHRIAIGNFTKWYFAPGGMWKWCYF